MNRAGRSDVYPRDNLTRLLLGLAVSVLMAAPATAAEPQEKAAEFDPKSLVGTRVDITAANGQTVADVELLDVREGRAEGTIVSITIPDGTTGKKRIVGANRIQQIAPAGGRAVLVFDAKRKALVPPEPDSEEKKPADTETASVRPGVRVWPELTNQQQKAAVEKQKAFLEEVNKKVPGGGMRLYETKRFLVYSDIPAQLINTMYVPYLDQMYTRLCGAFSLDPEDNIFQGKAPIIAYAEKASFEQFEAIFFQHTPTNAQGLAHTSSDGSVVISCYAGRDPQYFAAVLIHETAHGFVHRYRTSVHVPSWLNEGIAEWVTNLVLGGSRGIQAKVARAIPRLQATRSLGGNFFTADHIVDWQYGVAASMADFLLKYDPQPATAKTSKKTRRLKPEANRFRKLLDGIKDGMPWEENLKEAYGLTPEELAQKYGQAMGIPDLRP